MRVVLVVAGLAILAAIVAWMWNSPRQEAYRQLRQDGPPATIIPDDVRRQHAP